MELPLWYLECWLYLGGIVHGMISSKLLFCLMAKLTLLVCCSPNLCNFLILFTGWGSVSNTWEFGTPCYDGTSSWPHASAHVKESRVSDLEMLFFWGPPIWFWKSMKIEWCFSYGIIFSRHADKYVRRGRLDWPEGAASRESIKAVQKLPRLQVCLCFTYNTYWLCLPVKLITMTLYKCFN